MASSGAVFVAALLFTLTVISAEPRGGSRHLLQAVPPSATSPQAVCVNGFTFAGLSAPGLLSYVIPCRAGATFNQQDCCTAVESIGIQALVYNAQLTNNQVTAVLTDPNRALGCAMELDAWMRSQSLLLPGDQYIYTTCSANQIFYNLQSTVQGISGCSITDITTIQNITGQGLNQISAFCSGPGGCNTVTTLAGPTTACADRISQLGGLLSNSTGCTGCNALACADVIAALFVSYDFPTAYNALLQDCGGPLANPLSSVLPTLPAKGSAAAPLPSWAVEPPAPASAHASASASAPAPKSASAPSPAAPSSGSAPAPAPGSTSAPSSPGGSASPNGTSAPASGAATVGGSVMLGVAAAASVALLF